MSARVIADPVEFARARKLLEGEFTLTELARLQDTVASHEGWVTYRVSGGVDARGKPALRCRTEASVELTCQRCLGAMRVTISADSELLLVADTVELQQDAPDEADRLLATEAVDVQALVEDEILLALPMAPRHAEPECAGVAWPAGERTAAPFAVLAELKRRQDD